MNTKKNPVKKLSKGVLDLKFMKKTKEKAAIEVENEERQFLYQDQLAALNTTNKFVMMPSHFDVGVYLPCRLSFGGIEKDIEKLTQPKMCGVYEFLKYEPKEEETVEEADVNESEMASHFSSMNENLAKKFRPMFKQNKKRKSEDFKKPQHKQNKKRKSEDFKKPQHKPYKKRKSEDFIKPED